MLKFDKLLYTKKTRYVARPSFRIGSTKWVVELYNNIRKVKNEHRITFFISSKKWFDDKNSAVSYAKKQNKCLK